MLNVLKNYLKSNNNLLNKILYQPLRFIYHFLKNRAYSNAIVASWLDKHQTYHDKKLEKRALAIISKNGYKVQDIEEVYQKLKNQNDKVCHIMGGGWSVDRSVHKISPNDFVIGMNYTALANTHLNAYFVEQGISNEKETNLRIKIIDEIVSKQTDHIFYKNAYGPSDPNYITAKYAQKVHFIKSFPITCSHKKNINHSMEKFLRYDPIYLRQYKSTVISSIAFAKNIGFKNIVIHGLDFGGQYFYELDNFPEEKKKYIPPETSLSRGKKVHQTAGSVCGTNDVLAHIRDILYKQDIHLFSATNDSPSSKILKVYSPG